MLDEEFVGADHASFLVKLPQRAAERAWQKLERSMRLIKSS
jgi:hypothetical protein